MKQDNQGFDKQTFIVALEKKQTALLPGIGRFCLCGCGKKITGKRVTRRLKKGGTVSYDRPPQENKIFFSQACKQRYYMRTRDQKLRLTLQCGITLKRSGEGENEYRTITLYGKTSGTLAKYTLRKENHELLWNYLNKVEAFRRSGNRESNSQRDKINSISTNVNIGIIKKPNEGKTIIAK